MSGLGEAGVGIFRRETEHKILSMVSDGIHGGVR
jgi:hypothetical protein